MLKSRSDLSIFVLMLLIGIIFSFVYIVITGNIPQVYSDIIIEWTAYSATNKSLERIGMYLLIFLGLFIYTLYTYMCSVGKEDDNKTVGYEIDILSILLIIGIGVYCNISLVVTSLFCALPCIVIYRRKANNEVMKAVLTYFLLLYAFTGLYRILVILGAEFQLDSVLLSLFSAFIISLFAFRTSILPKLLARSALLCQLFIPGLILIFLANKYWLSNRVLVIENPWTVIIFTLILYFSFTIESLFKIWKYWNARTDFNNIIGLGTCMAIMIFNRFSGSGAIMSSDLHHPFENIIGYSQIFQLGQSAFSQYIPVSGMFSVVHGFIFEIFGMGLYSNYFIATNIFFAFITIMVVALLNLHIKRTHILVLGLFFVISDYNRISFILPIMLLLIYPSLIRRQALWLQVWIITGIFHGLYYPLFGTAVFIGFLPFAIKQFSIVVHSYSTNRIPKKDLAGWVFCFFLLALSFPWLLGSVKHIFAMAGQSVLADGIARFGQIPPSFFMSFIENRFVRLFFYDILTYLVPAIVVWLAYTLTLSVSDIRFVDKRFYIDKSTDGLLLLSLVITPLIGYSFTFIRVDPVGFLSGLLARSSGVVEAIAILIFVLSQRYALNKNIKRIISCVVFVFPIFTGVGVVAVNGVLGNSPTLAASISTGGNLSLINSFKLNYRYEVPENYVFVNNDFSKLGKGFMNYEIYEYVHDFWYQYHNRKETFFAINFFYYDFGLHYLTDLKGISIITTHPVKSYGATQETVEILKREKSIIGTSVFSLENYYLYKWILTSGYYVWDDVLQKFTYAKDRLSKDCILANNRIVSLTKDGRNLDRIPAVLGDSFATLEDLFEDKQVLFDVKQNSNQSLIEFTVPVEGNDIDFIYLEFEDSKPAVSYSLYDFSIQQIVEQESPGIGKLLMKENYNPGKVMTVQWEDDFKLKHSFNYAFDKGKILLPLGSGYNWLLHRHKKLLFTMEKGKQSIYVPMIKKMKFLKLREVL